MAPNPSWTLPFTPNIDDLFPQTMCCTPSIFMKNFRGVLSELWNGIDPKRRRQNRKSSINYKIFPFKSHLNKLPRNNDTNNNRLAQAEEEADESPLETEQKAPTSSNHLESSSPIQTPTSRRAPMLGQIQPKSKVLRKFEFLWILNLNLLFRIHSVQWQSHRRPPTCIQLPNPHHLHRSRETKVATQKPTQCRARKTITLLPAELPEPQILG